MPESPSKDPQLDVAEGDGFIINTESQSSSILQLDGELEEEKEV